MLVLMMTMSGLELAIVISGVIVPPFCIYFSTLDIRIVSESIRLFHNECAVKEGQHTIMPPLISVQYFQGSCSANDLVWQLSLSLDLLEHYTSFLLGPPPFPT